MADVDSRDIWAWLMLLAMRSSGFHEYFMIPSHEARICPHDGPKGRSCSDHNLLMSAIPHDQNPISHHILHMYTIRAFMYANSWEKKNVSMLYSTVEMLQCEVLSLMIVKVTAIHFVPTKLRFFSEKKKIIIIIGKIFDRCHEYVGKKKKSKKM